MDIPSLFMIPSAVSSGKVHSVFPNSTDADFDFNRDSDATRVNSEGLIERVGYYGSELVTNGDFSNGTNNWSFTDANGQVGSYFSRNEVCEIDFTNTSTIYASQSSILSNSKSYKITLDYYIPSTNASANYIQVRLGTTSSTSALTPNLNVLDNWTSATLYGVSNGTDLYIYTPSGAIGDKFYIDNVSVVEITGDRARLNYEIEGGLVNTKPSLLLEPQSTNLITYSEDYSQSDWVKSKSGSNSSIPIVTDNYAISPDGSTNASRVQFDCGSTSSSDYVMINQNISLDGSSTYALSFYIKSNSSENQSLLFFTQSSFGASITATSEWQRVETTLTSNTTNARGFGLVARGSIQQEVDILIYGGQLEQQSYSTSLIPTNGSTQTRAAETCNGAGTSSIFESSEGILYCEIAALTDLGSYRLISLSSSASASNRVTIAYDVVNNQIYGQCVASGTGQALFTTQPTSISDFHKIALKYKANDFAFWVDGVRIGTDTSGSIPTGLNSLSFDRADGAAYFYGKCRDIRVYNTKEMTDSEVDILLTKITS
jgi:hypothetical protein